MGRRLKQVVLVFVVALAGAQLIRPDRANPPIDTSRTIGAHAGTARTAAILDRACGQCHSNATTWPWYTRVAPLSWLMASAVGEGRRAVNYSEWAGYGPERQQELLVSSCQAVTTGKMPGSLYNTLYPETRLSGADVATICATGH